MVSCQLLLQMVEEIAFVNGRISNFERLATLALTLDRVMLHTVVRHSSTSTYTPNFIEILWTDGRTYTHTHERNDRHLRQALFGRLCRRVNLKILVW